MTRRNLIVVRCGANSLHGRWLEGADRNWDIVLCPYEDIDPGELASFPKFGVYKFKALHALLCEWRQWRDYDYICFPDDDLLARADDWNRFFDFCHEVKAHLATPALTPDSYTSHLVMLQNMSFRARETTFAEVMTPCMSRDFLEQAHDTMQLSRTGLGMGLDLLWPALLSYRDIWISDATPVRHTRPVGSLRAGAFADLASYDMWFTKQLGAPWLLETIGGILPDGRHVQGDAPGFAALLRAGWAWVAEVYPAERATLPQLAASPRPPPQPQVVAAVRRALSFLARPDNTISRGKPCRTSSVSPWSWTRDPDLEGTGANDGLVSGVAGFHTDCEVNPWWQVDLQQKFELESIVLYNRLDHVERCIDFDVLVSTDSLRWTVALSKRDGAIFGGVDGGALKLKFPPATRGRFVRVQAMGETYLHLDQVEVFGAPAGRGQDRADPGEAQRTADLQAVALLERLMNHPRGAFLMRKLASEVLDAKEAARR